MGQPAIALKNLTFAWQPQQLILKDCSLEIPRGEFWMLLGSNGMLSPQTGECYVEQPLGFVFQNPDHQLVMPTVGADVAFGLVSEQLNWTQVRDRVQEALSAVNLAGWENRPIYALSGGQKQRIAIAGAIARNCPVLLLDEPTALLDPEMQQELVQQVRSLVKERGITALWVTHRLDELDYSDRAFILEEGKITKQGSPQELKNYVTSVTSHQD
jgi:energy-coupling factor transport system ATP-binding protein